MLAVAVDASHTERKAPFYAWLVIFSFAVYIVGARFRVATVIFSFAVYIVGARFRVVTLDGGHAFPWIGHITLFGRCPFGTQRVDAPLGTCN